MSKAAKRCTISTLVVLLLSFVCYRSHCDLASAIPLYLLVVVMQSLAGDFRSSAIICVLSAICLDLFFTEPLFSLRITNPLNILALTAFIVTSLVITRLHSRVCKEAAIARLQTERAGRLYRLSQELLAFAPDQVKSDRLLEPFQRLFGVTSLCVFDVSGNWNFNLGAEANDLANKTRDAFILGRDVDEPGSGLAVRRLLAGGRVTGAAGFAGTADLQEAAGALTVLLATLLERSSAIRQAGESALLAQTEAYRSAMLDALAHEFQTPLATILAAAGGIQEAGPLSPQQREMAATVETEAAQLGGLTSRLLRTARLDCEEIRPRRELLNFTALVSQVASHYEARAGRRFTFRSEEQTVEAAADPELLRLAVNQLVENACKYSLPDTPVTIRIAREGDTAALRVTNKGGSLAGEERRIFDRFYRGERMKRSTAGSGLGLYVARKIARAHDGVLALETGDDNAGDITFCLKIPRFKEETDDVFTVE